MIKNSKKIKVLLVVHCFLPESVGGTELYSLHLAHLLSRNGLDVVVLSAVEDMKVKRFTVSQSVFEGIRVIRIANSNLYARSFMDYFMNPSVDALFKGILAQELPDLVHFQHSAFLSGNLPEIASQQGVPNIFTLHDYWFMCYRSHLRRPGLGLCPGPSEGVYCASCHDASEPNPTAVPKYRMMNTILQLPGVRMLNLKERLTPELKQKLRRLLYLQHPPGGGHESDLQNPSAMQMYENQFRFFFFRRQFTYPKYVLSPSFHLKRRYEQVGYREITHLPLGFFRTGKVSTPVFDGRLRVAYLGNLMLWKGARVILDELRTLPRKDRVEIHFHGRPNDQLYFEELQRLAGEFPEGSVAFHGGYRSDRELKDILSKVHLVVFPSLWEENYPLVVRETLLHGVPVIGSRLGGVPEAVEDGVNGFLFDPYKKGDLAVKINLLLDDPGVLAKITEGARNTKIESMDDHLEKILKVYDDAIGSR